MEHEIVGEFAPAKLSKEFLARRRMAARSGSSPDLTRADLAEGEMRRQARGCLLRWHVTALPVVCQPIVEEVGETCDRGDLAGCPGRAKARCPIGPGRHQAPRGEFVAWRPEA